MADTGSLADRDELARRKAAEASAQQAREAELKRREEARKGQEKAAKTALPPLVQAG